jgi:hypothetical protein
MTCWFCKEERMCRPICSTCFDAYTTRSKEDKKEIEVHHDKRQRLLNRLTDKILSVPLENWTWTREEWVVWIKNHRISLPADFEESLKIGVWLGVTTRPDVPIETRNTDRIKALVHALSVRREEIQQEKIEATLKDIEEGSDG